MKEVYMHRCSQPEYFSIQAAGKATFKKFDEDGSGDIDVCELSDMLRFQGHHTSIDEAAAQDPFSHSQTSPN